MPRLHKDWRKLLRHAWSVRFIGVAAILSGAEVALPLYQPYVNVDPLWFAAGIGLCTAAAFVSRLLAQREFAGVTGV